MRGGDSAETGTGGGSGECRGDPDMVDTIRTHHRSGVRKREVPYRDTIDCK
jgi:hypothetical protein